MYNVSSHYYNTTIWTESDADDADGVTEIHTRVILPERSGARHVMGCGAACLLGLTRRGRREEARRGRTVQLTSSVRGGAAATRSSVIMSRAVRTCGGGCVSAFVLCMQRQTCQPEHGPNHKVQLFADLENHEP